MPSVALFQLCYRMYSALILIEPLYEVPLPVWYDDSCQPAPTALDLRVSIPSVNWDAECRGEAPVIFLLLGTSNVPETSSRQAGDLANFESDPIKILPQLLDQLIALGQTAQQLRQALDNNGHHPDKVADPIRQTLQGGGHGS